MNNESPLPQGILLYPWGFSHRSYRNLVKSTIFRMRVLLGRVIAMVGSTSLNLSLGTPYSAAQCTIDGVTYQIPVINSVVPSFCRM